MKLKLFSSGKASIARRSRQADGCDAVEELEPINQNLQIDFKFQVNWMKHAIIMYIWMIQITKIVSLHACKSIQKMKWHEMI